VSTVCALSMPPIEIAEEARDVDLARAGDRLAFARLFERFAPMVHGVLLARAPRSDVDDLMQDVFMAALQRLSSLRDTRALGPWLAALARNRAADHHRRAPMLIEVSDEVAVIDRRAEANQVLAVIRTLPEAYRETLVLRLVEGLSSAEIGEQVGLTPESVRVNVHRGTKLLKERLGLGGKDDE
jgi:RNA polymerase sigma-70 factor (ECF subfamily)